MIGLLGNEEAPSRLGGTKPPRRRGAGSVDRNDQDLLSWRVEERLNPQFGFKRRARNQVFTDVLEWFDPPRDRLGSDVNTAAEAIFLGRPLRRGRFRSLLADRRVIVPMRSDRERGFGLADGGK
jgi:hypothetical protein